ncbi:unnamed protein product [Aureobasidium vineae]|uniref:Uncharacterized protein n=1 Tax=Aureobasidium vineae TaxID=2773715 RepID=A0A9N8JZD0_9PEZI|nr:unnamed protein product [Aureobasidium vineae]
MADSSAGTFEQDQNIPAAAQDGCALLENMFSASQDLLDTLRALNDGTPQSNPFVRPSEGSLPILSNPKSLSSSPEAGGLNILLGNTLYESKNDWSSSIIRHMIMANHMLLFNTYLAAIMALQHAVNKQHASLGTPDPQQHALPLGEMRTAMVAQMCSYLIQRQINAVQAYLNPSSASKLSELKPSDQATMGQLETDVQKRLACLRGSLPM